MNAAPPDEVRAECVHPHGALGSASTDDGSGFIRLLREYVMWIVGGHEKLSLGSILTFARKNSFNKSQSTLLFSNETNYFPFYTLSINSFIFNFFES